jgi:hypothetical protein
MKTIAKGAIICVAALFAHSISAQTNLNFNGITVTTESAIRLSWNSTSNEVYEVDYATELLNDGGTVWNPLYEDYPSHGTNTFIADAGNYDQSPDTPHPKLSGMRFYRIKLVETNTSPTNPQVSITSPTNGSSLSDEVTVVVASSSSEFLTDVTLFVDGEEQWASLDRTNFVINTCEWPNGPHTLFAVAKSQSGFEGIPNGPDITHGRTVSSYVNVTFDNLITRFDFSERFFEPALGQTQKVTAVFAANVDWTLEIQNASSNDVRYVTGNGSSMQFDWDGTGTNGANLPNGVYSYLLTAQTNGQQMMMSGGDNSFASSAFEDITELWAWPAEDSGSPVPLFLYPPGFDTNGFTIFEASQSEVLALNKVVKALNKSVTAAESRVVMGNVGGNGGVAEASSSSPTQNTRGPTRKPRVGVKGEVGTFGICYKTYGTNGFTSPHPLTGWPYPLPTRVALDGQSAQAQTVDRRLTQFHKIAKDFKEFMEKAAWKPSFVKPNDQWSSVDVKKPSKGGNSIFNTVNFGLMMTHGSYATTAESDSVKYTYLWLLTLSNNVSESLRLSDMDFGSPGTNGLRWMTIYACNILRPENYNSMNNAGKIPVNEDLHLLLGGSTLVWSCEELGTQYANNLTRNDKTIIDAFNSAGTYAHALDHGGITNVVKFATAGWPACFNDKLSGYNDPDTINGLTYQEYQIYTP